MSVDHNERYIFEAEWYDRVASTLKKFYLFYYPSDNTVELFDLKARRTFLRRSHCEGIHAKDFYVGAVVTIFSRSIKITDYADANTKAKLHNKLQKTFALLKPDVLDKVGEILKRIQSYNFHISNIRMIRLDKEQASLICHSNHDSDKKSALEYLTSGPVMALEIMGDNAVTRWNEIIGPEDSEEARIKTPFSLRAYYGKNKIYDAIYGSPNQESAQKEVDLFFPITATNRTHLRNTATFDNCTCCIIKPHAVQARLSGDIIEDIQKAGFKISALKQFIINSYDAEEFLEVYKGVLPDYGAMVGELQSGPCIVMEIKYKDNRTGVQSDFRNLCGPMDPDIARQVRPDTLRAKYGKTKVQNAIHCSDLAEDGILEVEYFFKILDGN